VSALVPTTAAAQGAPLTAATRPLEATSAQPPVEPEAPRGLVLAAGRASLTLTGYVEAFWQWNINNPGNGLTAWRGFDNRHNSVTLSNVVLDAAWRYGVTQGRLALQVGHTPESYYGAEPRMLAMPGGTRTDADVWKYLQQANVGVRFGALSPTLLEAGLFLTPIGPESMGVRDNWNWSRSNLFYGLPYYHTGLRLTHTLNTRHGLSFAVFNGWNSVVDNNAAKSIMAQYQYSPGDDLALSALYFGGIERGDVDPGGPSWRHMLDLWVRGRASRRVELMGHVNVGFEPNRVGTNFWFAAAAYARAQLTRRLAVALRADFFYDDAPNAQLRLFWPSAWMASQTATLDVQPNEHVSLRVEYRHDIAEGSSFYRGQVTEPGAMGLVFNTRTQDTLTLGMVSGF
jgi:hypothetical protein